MFLWVGSTAEAYIARGLEKPAHELEKRVIVVPKFMTPYILYSNTLYSPKS